MVLKLYGHPMSYTTQVVMLVLAETKTPYEFELVDLQTGAHKTPEYLAKNPLGQIPCMVRPPEHRSTDPHRAMQDDDGFVLFESIAIARYVALKAASPFVPTGDLHKVALHEQALAVEETTFGPNMYQILRHRIYLPLMGGGGDEAIAAVHVEKLASKLPAYETLLSRNRFLAGDAMMLADLAHVPLGAFLAPQGFTWFADADKYPNIAR
jgi:glutathione S-transferase